MSSFFHAWKLAIIVVVNSNVQLVFLFYFCTNSSTCFIIHPPTPKQKSKSLLVCSHQSQTVAIYQNILSHCHSEQLAAQTKADRFCPPSVRYARRHSNVRERHMQICQSRHGPCVRQESGVRQRVKGENGRNMELRRCEDRKI